MTQDPLVPCSGQLFALNPMVTSVSLNIYHNATGTSKRTF